MYFKQYDELVPIHELEKWALNIEYGIKTWHLELSLEENYGNELVLNIIH